MNPVAFMAWRIGAEAALLPQIAWIHAHGFDAVSFHTSPGPQAARAGFDAAAAPPEATAALERALRPFRQVELHAPFEAFPLAVPLPPAWSREDHPLGPTLRLAERIRANVITVHVTDRDVAGGPHASRSLLAARLAEFAASRPSGARVGIETSRLDYLEVVALTGAPGIGLTMDIGHFFLGDRAALKAFDGALAALVRTFLPATVHFHLHDVRNGIDHLPPTGEPGEVDFNAFFQATCAGEYDGAFCWELNPDRATPKEIAATPHFTRSHLRDAGCG
ncbi:MAG: sugar phosphate isomerase/epimerase [Kiritimatiellaeota bacterium]|nr:sugar phosphate isomerase/epimerase [Kiritimatiellota bacterium]